MGQSRQFVTLSISIAPGSQAEESSTDNAASWFPAQAR